MIKKLILVVVLLLIVAAGGYFFLNAKGSETNTETSSVEVASPSSEASPSGAIKEFIVDGSNFAFAPSEIKVQKGDTVKIIFKDKVGTHNLVIDGYNVKTKTISGGSEDSVTFVADKTGRFEYYCSVGNHKENGMVGAFIVE